MRPLVLALTVVTGFTGLAYEVSWQKYLAILLGAHSEATASVLGLFLGGLSLGYWLFGALTRRLVARGRRIGRPAPLLRVYGAVEAGIGAYCLIFPAYFELVRSISVRLPIGAGPVAFAVDVVLAAFLIVPPATLMGGTIPVLTQALARGVSDATRLHALVYASNTAGAFAGALATGFFLIDWIGLAGVVRAMGVINLAAGAGFALLGLRRREIAELDPGAPAPRGAGVLTHGAVALLVGFAMMVLQTIVIRVGGLAFGPSEYTFTMVVAVFVLCIAVGSLGVAVFPRIARLALPVLLWSLTLVLGGLYFALETSPYWAHLVRVMYRDIPAAFYPYYAAVFTAILVTIGPAAALSGAVLPLLFHAVRREQGTLGAVAGRLYSVNTVGSLLGALIGGYVLLIWLDLHHVYRIAVAALALAAVLVTLHEVPRVRFAGAAGLLLVALFLIERFPAWRPAYLMAGTFRERHPTEWTFAGPSALGLRQAPDAFPFYDDDPNTSVAVQQFGSGGDLSRSILVNGKSDGDTRFDLQSMTLTGIVPALFAEHPARVFVVGLGTGVTVGAIAELDEVESVTVAEISRGVVAARPYFDFANHGVSSHPKVRVVQSDAYRALLERREQFDLIVTEPSNPWVTGVEQLYSREFLEQARDRLAPGGVYCQWFHLYETNAEATELVLKTYAAVFDRVAVWSTNYADRLLIGFREAAPALDVARLAQRMERPDFRRPLARLGIRDLPALLVHETLPVGVVNRAALAGPVHSLYAPKLGFAAGRGFFVGHEGPLPFTGYGEPAEVGAANSLLGRYLASLSGAPLAAARSEIAHRACAEILPGCRALAAAWALTEPDPAAYEALSQGLEPIDPSVVRRISGFLATSPQDSQGPIAPAAALELTKLYMSEYSHAAPFQPEALLEVWEHCGADLCRRGVNVAERLVRGDAPPAPDDWLRAAVRE